MRGHKYGAVPTVIDNIRFASKAEARRYAELRLLEKAGVIEQLELQPKFKLVVNGATIGTYIADFRYRDAEWNLITEDVKSVATKTAIYRLKKKFVEAQYGITIAEVFMSR